MVRKKAFRGGRAITEFDPIEFELNDQVFTCKPALQGAVLLEFVSKADSESGGAAAGALYGFFEDAMDPSEYIRFVDYLKSPDIIIEMSLIGDIAGWLVEQYTDRPTQAPVPSGTGQSSAGTTSTDAGSYEA